MIRLFCINAPPHVGLQGAALQNGSMDELPRRDEEEVVQALGTVEACR
jgi:hypothetical protein